MYLFYFPPEDIYFIPFTIVCLLWITKYFHLPDGFSLCSTWQNETLCSVGELDTGSASNYVGFTSTFSLQSKGEKNLFILCSFILLDLGVPGGCREQCKSLWEAVTWSKSLCIGKRFSFPQLLNNLKLAEHLPLPSPSDTADLAISLCDIVHFSQLYWCLLLLSPVTTPGGWIPNF